MDDGETSNEGTKYSMFCIVHVEFTSHINRKREKITSEGGIYLYVEGGTWQRHISKYIPKLCCLFF